MKKKIKCTKRNERLRSCSGEGGYLRDPGGVKADCLYQKLTRTGGGESKHSADDVRKKGKKGVSNNKHISSKRAQQRVLKGRTPIWVVLVP